MAVVRNERASDGAGASAGSSLDSPEAGAGIASAGNGARSRGISIPSGKVRATPVAFAGSAWTKTSTVEPWSALTRVSVLTSRGRPEYAGGETTKARRARSGGWSTTISTRGTPRSSSPPETTRPRSSWTEGRTVRKVSGPLGPRSTIAPLSKERLTSSGTTPSARTMRGTSRPRAARTTMRSGSEVSTSRPMVSAGTSRVSVVARGHATSAPSIRAPKMRARAGSLPRAARVAAAQTAPIVKRRAGRPPSVTRARSIRPADSSAAAAMRSTSSAAGVAGSTVRVSSSALMKRSSTASAAGSAR